MNRVTARRWCLAANATLLSIWLCLACDEPKPHAAAPSPAPSVPEPGPAPATPRPELPLLAIRFDVEGWKKLVAQMQAAHKRGVHVQDEDPWASITLDFGGKHLEAKARLKGDLLEHLDPEHPSLRIKLAAFDRVFGQRDFAVQAPKTRNYHAEPLYFEQLRGLGVLTPRYRFVHLAFGDQHPSLMAMEEAFSKELLESQQRRESVMVHFDESYFWRTDLNHDELYLPVVPFKAGRTERLPNLRHYRELATGLLRGFVEGKLPASQVFDVERTASFLAVSELWDSWHALRWNNLRFYYDPFSGRLEPVAYDADATGAPFYDQVLNLAGRYPGFNRVVQERWLADATLRTRFFERLHELAKRVVDGPLLEELQARERSLLAELPAGVFDANRIDWKRFAARAAVLVQLDADNYTKAIREERLAQYMKHKDEPFPLSEGKLLDAYLASFLVSEARKSQIELFNLLTRDVTITAVEGAKLAPAVHLPLVVPAAGPAQTSGVTLALAAAPANLAGVKVLAEVTGALPGIAHPLQSYPAARSQPVLPELTLAELQAANPWLRVDAATRSVHVPAGTHPVQKTLWLPQGYAIDLEPGVTLRFARDAALVVRGGCRIHGSATAPVRLEPSGADWPGLVVLASGARCDVQHLVVARTRGVSGAEWELTGGATFHGAQLSLRDASFAGTTAEDALNVVSSQLSIERIQVSATRSDGVDSDHCTGTVREVTCEKIGADCMDTSGSRLTIEILTVHGAGDKALSVGELSTLTVNTLNASDTNLGVAVKDGSSLNLTGASLERVKGAALLAYRKKPEYGPAFLEARGLGMKDVGSPYGLQEGHRIVLEGRDLVVNNPDIAALYPDLDIPPAPAAKP